MPVILLVFIFILLPTAEIYCLIKIGQLIGPLNTIFLLFFSGIIGTYLARLEGLRVFSNLQRDLHDGKMPQDKLLDGMLILVGGVLLIIPGFITDIFAFILFIPFTRFLVKLFIKRRIRKMLDEKNNVITITQFRRQD